MGDLGWGCWLSGSSSLVVVAAVVVVSKIMKNGEKIINKLIVYRSRYIILLY